MPGLSGQGTFSTPMPCVPSLFTSSGTSSPKHSSSWESSLSGSHRFSASEATNWALDPGFFLGSQFNYWGSIFVALGWVGVIMLFCQNRAGSRLYRSLAATGQMALTNYVTQTLICTTLFYGHGFGPFEWLWRSLTYMRVQPISR